MAVLAPLRERPGLLFGELAWRWSCGGLLLLLAGYQGWRIVEAWLPWIRATGLLSLSGDSLLEDPSRLTTAFAAASAIVMPPIEHAAWGLGPLAVFCWVAAFAWGRSGVLRSYDVRLPRRPWLLAAAEGSRLAVMLAASAVWGELVQLSSAVALRGSAPNGLLYGVLVLAATVLVLAGWGRIARTIEAAMALGLVDSLGFLTAFRAAWQLRGSAISAEVGATRKAAGRLRLWLVGAAVVFTLLPAPFSTGWQLVAWWLLLSLVLLAGADAVRLGVLFALLGATRARRAAMGGSKS
ncbi:hypothetical protein D1Y84_03735 [Acidipila sp. EB88]|nr:hypothetical protein D1Y84_03735 [Acidipila sp. EB88]